MQLSRCGKREPTISGGNGEGVPPVPIPNTEVKTFSADGTWLDTARESRSPPDSKSTPQGVLFFVVQDERKLRMRSILMESDFWGCSRQTVAVEADAVTIAFYANMLRMRSTQICLG